jgi:exonuclease 3'-5' domain-containing protein 1
MTSLQAMMDALLVSKDAFRRPRLYLDLEGNDLGREGTLDIVQLYDLPSSQLYLIHVHKLGDAVFHTPSQTSNMSLREILESGKITKVMFDVRNDSDALFWHHGVRLNKVHDLQLMELGTRSPELPLGRSPRKTTWEHGREDHVTIEQSLRALRVTVYDDQRYVMSLKECIRWDAGLDRAVIKPWLETKSKGKDMFLEDQDVFKQLPMDETMIRYCTQDVSYLPLLWKAYHDKIIYDEQASVRWNIILSESLLRVQQSWLPEYNRLPMRMPVLILTTGSV